MKALSLTAAAGLLLASTAWAQDEAAPQPPPAAPPQAAAPAKHGASGKGAAAPAAGAATAANEDEGVGTTLIGDRESPIGLYLTPWKNEYAERGMDRPAQFVQEKMAPIDPRVFARQLEYDTAIDTYRKLELSEKK
jgi:hypothetical protein